MPVTRQRLYCGKDHAYEARRRSRLRAAASRMADAALRPDDAGALTPDDASALDNPPVAATTEHPTENQHRQAPLARPPFTLTWDRRIDIAAARPAPLRRYPNGAPTLFQDDLNARADHGSPGSPGAPPRPDDFRYSPISSALGGAM